MSKIIIIPTIFSSSYNVPSIYKGDSLAYSLLGSGASVPNLSGNTSSLFSNSSPFFTKDLFNGMQAGFSYLGAVLASDRLMTKLDSASKGMGAC